MSRGTDIISGNIKCIWKIGHRKLKKMKMVFVCWGRRVFKGTIFRTVVRKGFSER